MPKVAFYTQSLYQNEFYTSYLITYYTDGSALVKVYQKNGRTNCYQYVGSINVPQCTPPVPIPPN